MRAVSLVLTQPKLTSSLSQVGLLISCWQRTMDQQDYKQLRWIRHNRPVFDAGCGQPFSYLTCKQFSSVSLVTFTLMIAHLTIELLDDQSHAPSHFYYCYYTSLVHIGWYEVIMWKYRQTQWKALPSQRGQLNEWMDGRMDGWMGAVELYPPPGNPPPAANLIESFTNADGQLGAAPWHLNIM